MSELIENRGNDENQDTRPETWDPDKSKYPHGDREQSIGSWWNPEPNEQNVEYGIGNSR